jgi:hypothetical protein
MSKIKSFFHFILCVIILIAFNAPAAYSTENCEQETIEKELNEKLSSQLALDPILKTIVILNGPMVSIEPSSMIPNTKTLRLNDIEGLRSSGIAPPRL